MTDWMREMLDKVHAQEAKEAQQALDGTLRQQGSRREKMPSRLIGATDLFSIDMNEYAKWRYQHRAEIQQALRACGGACQVCGDDVRQLVLDRTEATGDNDPMLRGVVCRTCRKLLVAYPTPADLVGRIRQVRQWAQVHRTHVNMALAEAEAQVCGAAIHYLTSTRHLTPVEWPVSQPEHEQPWFSEPAP